jgi:hypothetical protein
MTRETTISIGLMLAAVACATAPAPPPSATDRTVVTTLDRVIKDQSGIPSNNVLVKAAKAEVMAALKSVYSDLGIEVKHFDPISGQVGNRNFSKTGSLAGERISNFLSCGMMILGEAADNYRVTISAISQVTAGDGGSNVETWLTASARDLGTSSDNVSCATKGTLENKINQLVQERIAH